MIDFFNVFVLIDESESPLLFTYLEKCNPFFSAFKFLSPNWLKNSTNRRNHYLFNQTENREYNTQSWLFKDVKVFNTVPVSITLASVFQCISSLISKKRFYRNDKKCN